MKVKDLKALLSKAKDEDEILFSSDEDLNCLREDGTVAYLKDLKKYVIYGFDGTEIDY